MDPWIIVAFLGGFIFGVYLCFIGTRGLQDEYEEKIKKLEAKIEGSKDQ